MPQQLQDPAPLAIILGHLQIFLILTGAGVLLWQIISRFSESKIPAPPFSAPKTTWSLSALAAATAGIFILGNIAGALPFLVYAEVLKQTDPEALAPIRGALNNYSIIAGMACGQLFAIVAILILRRHLAPDFRFNEPAVRDKKTAAWHPLACILGGFALSWIGGLISILLKKSYEHLAGEALPLPTQELFEIIAAEKNNLFTISILVFAGTVLAPISEELFFRGILFRLFRTFSLRVAAAAACGALFGLIHFNVLAFIPLSLFGAYLCYVYEKNGDIRAPILVHAAFNLNSFLIMILAPELAKSL